MKTQTFVLVVLLVFAAGAWADPPVWSINPLPSDAEDPTLLSAWSKAKAEAVRSDVVRLRRLRVDALLEEADARFKEFVAGRGTLAFCQSALLRLKDAEQALAETDAERLAAVEKLWLFQWQIYEVNDARFRSGAIAHQDLMGSLYYLRDTEIAMVDAWVRNGRQSGTGLSAGVVIVEDARDSKTLLQAKRRALTTPPRQLAEERLAATNEEWSDVYAEFVAGRGLLDRVLDTEQRWAKAQLTLSTDEEDRTAVRERLWRQAIEADRINQARWESARINIQDYMESRAWRLTAQIDWASKAGQPPSSSRIIRPGMPRTQTQLEETVTWSPVSPRDLREAWLIQPTQLAKERAIAADVEVDARFKEFVAGRGTLDFLLRASVRLAEAEEAVATTPQDRLTARENHWQRTWQMERINRARFEAGKIAVQDLTESREYLLEAELKWLELHQKPERK